MSRELTEEVWADLQGQAVQAMQRAYCPYSHYPVGAAALVSDGRVVVGCNVENAGYGVTLCAECGLVSSLIAGGGGQLEALVCVDGRGQLAAPCGRCRQLLSEHAAPSMLIAMPQGRMTMNQVLPGAFGPAALDVVAAERKNHG